jgi:integrase
MGYIRENPFVGLRNVRLGQKIVQPFSPDEVKRLLSASYPIPYLEARNRAIIWLMLDTGLRLNELCSLQLEDLDMVNERLKVLNGKGNKQRVVRVGDEAMAALKNYIDTFRVTEPGPLFLTEDGGPMSRNAVRVMLVRLGEKAGVRKVFPHRFRHTFATWAIEHEAREIDVQYLLGHSTPAMVRRYSATYNSEKAAQAHVRWSPGSILAREMALVGHWAGERIFLRAGDGSRSGAHPE